MQPQIRYVESADGTRIAYSVIGSGPPLVITPVLPGTHLEIDWRLPDREGVVHAPGAVVYGRAL